MTTCLTKTIRAADLMLRAAQGRPRVRPHTHRAATASRKRTRDASMTLHFQVAELASGSYWPLAILRWSMVAVFIWFAIQKFTPYAAEAIAPLIASSPFVRWLGVFGVRGEAKIIGTIELTTAALLIIGSVIPWVSALGAAMACGTFLLTSSFVVTTPGTFQKGSPAIPVVATLLGQFLLKDLALLAVCVTLLPASLS